MIKKKYSDTEFDFVFEWVDRWFQLVHLIIELVRDDRAPGSPPPPTDLDEIKYQSLRFWFIDYEERFKPLWRDFYESQDWALHSGDADITEMSDGDKYIENPFFFCYRPENLYRLVQELDIQSGIDLWEPSKHRTLTAAKELIQMDYRVVEFFEWIDERA